MRYLWIGGVIAIAILGAGCSGSGTSTTQTTLVHHRPHVTTTTTTTLPPTTTTKPLLPSGPWDQAACASLTALDQVAGEGHARIADAFRTMFWTLRRAENTTLRRAGHRAAVELLMDNVAQFKLALAEVYHICKEMS